MKHFLLSLLLLTSLQLYSQRIDKASILKKGFYKNYNEYLNNSPSVTDSFTIVLFQRTKTDTTVVSAKYYLRDSLKELINIWGFCDGNSVFIKYRGNQFWKLECIGKYSCFLHAYKTIVLMGSPLTMLMTSTISATLPSDFDLMIIDANGKFKPLSFNLMKKYLKPYPDLLNDFSKTAKLDDENSNEFSTYDDPYLFNIELSKKYLKKINELE